MIVVLSASIRIIIIVILHMCVDNGVINMIVLICLCVISPVIL